MKLWHSLRMSASIHSATSTEMDRIWHSMEFTDKARHVLVLAREEAAALKRPHVGTEHLLLGLAKEPDGMLRRLSNAWHNVREGS